jgi:hypothetical protein
MEIQNDLPKEGPTKVKLEEKKASLKEKITKNKKNVIAGIIILALILAGAGYSYNKKKQASKQEAAKEKVLSFIKDNLVQPGTDVQITKFEQDKSLYKLTLSVNKQEIIAYLTKDGSTFFPQAIDLNKKEDPAASQNAQPKAAAEAATKAAVPEVDLFVMSQCPYGVQAEKGILPVIQKLGSKVNFKLKFVSYTLHGKKEFDENLNQYCIEKTQPASLVNYLNCYTVSGDSAACAITAKINKATVASCVSSTDSSLKLTEAFNSGGQTPPFAVDKAENDKYGVQGSPTLVVNGTVLDSGRDSASLMKAICSGFSTQPAECNATLSSTAPAAGFGSGTASGSASSASCGQ